MKVLLIIFVCLIVYAALLAVILLFFKGVSMADDEYCSVGSPDEPNMHCVHWYDSEACCRCHAPAMTWNEAFKDGAA